MKTLERAEDEFFVHYQDDGARGIVPQCMSITAPRSVLYRTTSEHELREFFRLVERNTSRKNPRITGVWSTNPDLGYELVETVPAKAESPQNSEATARFGHEKAATS